MPKALTKSDGYKSLVKKITLEFAELEFFVKNRVAQGHWNVGKYIHEHLLEHKDRADYGATLYERLAKDVGRDKSTLLRSVQFYRTYPIVAAQRQLTWDHYKSLLPIKDAAKSKKIAVKIHPREVAHLPNRTGEQDAFPQRPFGPGPWLSRAV